MTREELKTRKIRAYRRLYEFTRGQCTDCARTDCACKDSICAHVEAHAGQPLCRGTHPRLRFIGAQGCTVPPHMRETCTIYLCEPARSRPDFPRLRYQRLVRVCERIEERLMESE